MISRKKYLELALREIFDFEILYDHPVYPDGMRLPVLHERRYRWMLNSLWRSLSDMGCYVPNGGEGREGVVLSLGCFPGSFDRILNAWFDMRIHILGVGLSIGQDFKDAFMGNVYDEIYAVELDPLHPDNLSEMYPVVIPVAEKSVDVVVAGEVFEHLYSPLHFLREISRVLRPGGRLILTTPNICYIGNLVKLLMGHSCHEAVVTSHIYMNSEWRAHMRVYDRYELAMLCGKNGLNEIRTEFLDNGEDHYYSSRKTKFKMMLLRIAYLRSTFRNNLCQIYKKEEQDN